MMVMRASFIHSFACKCSLQPVRHLNIDIASADGKETPARIWPDIAVPKNRQKKGLWIGRRREDRDTTAVTVVSERCPASPASKPSRRHIIE